MIRSYDNCNYLLIYLMTIGRCHNLIWTTTPPTRMLLLLAACCCLLPNSLVSIQMRCSLSSNPIIRDMVKSFVICIGLVFWRWMDVCPGPKKRVPGLALQMETRNISQMEGIIPSHPIPSRLPIWTHTLHQYTHLSAHSSSINNQMSHHPHTHGILIVSFDINPPTQIQTYMDGLQNPFLFVKSHIFFMRTILMHG